MTTLDDVEDSFVPAPKWRPKTETKKSELEELKSLVRTRQGDILLVEIGREDALKIIALGHIP